MNKAIAVQQIYPNAIPMKDFVVINDDGIQKIIQWNYPQPQPTEEELLTAYDAYITNKPSEVPSDMDMLGQRIVDLELRLMLGGL